MTNARLVRTFVLGVTALVIGTAYADTVNGPGTPPLNITITFNVDSKIQSTTSGSAPVGLSNGSGTAKIISKMDADGNIPTIGSVVFDAFDDGVWGYQMYSNNFYGGHYCPNSGVATVSFSAEIVVWKANGTTLGVECLISMGSVTLTTETSGGFSGTRFTQPGPKMVAQTVFPEPHGPLIGWPMNCDGQAGNTGSWLAIKNHFKTSSTATAGFQLFHVNIDPHPYGDGC